MINAQIFNTCVINFHLILFGSLINVLRDSMMVFQFSFLMELSYSVTICIEIFMAYDNVLKEMICS